MAMVVRSKKILNPQIVESGKIGPGEYFQSSNLIDPTKIEQVNGFGTGERNLFEGKGTPDNIGPGAYLKDSSLIKNSFSTSNIHSIENVDYQIYKLLLKRNEDIKNTNENLEINNSSLNLSIINEQKKKKFVNLNNKNNNNLNNNCLLEKQDKLIKIIPSMENRVSSIPSKLDFGYTIEPNGLIKKLDDPFKEIRYSGEKNDSTSPDYYYKEQKSKIKSTLDWGKMSKKDLETYKTKNNFLKKDSNNFNNYSNVNRNSSINLGNTNTVDGSSNIDINNIKENLSNSIKENINNNTINILDNNNVITYGNTSSIDINNQSIKNNCKNENNDLLFSPNSNTAFKENLNRSLKKSNSYYSSSYKSKMPLLKSTSSSVKKNNSNNNINNSTLNFNADDLSTSEMDTFLNTNKTSMIEELVNKNLFNISPGPGYYFDDEPYHFSKTNYSLISSFGSLDKRKMSYMKIPKYLVGPGSYFRDKNKIKKSIYHKNRNNGNLLSLAILKNKNNDSNLLKNNTINNKEGNPLIGPGTYTIKSQFDKTKYNYSGPHEKRFKIIKKEDVTPGPGDYLELPYWEKKRNNILPKIFEENEFMRESRKIISNIEKGTPGVGAYNPEIVNSIMYNIVSKENKFSSAVAPFSSAEDRFVRKSGSTSNILGPGIYNFAKSDFNKTIKSGVHELNKPPAKYKEEKEEAKRMVGPGSYGMYNYNNWNKKSFNVLFV